MTSSSPPPPGHPGQIGHFKILELLGEGGMGEVWLAEQTEPVRRQVALKVLKLGMDTKQFLARLEAERQALAVMDHPHIARFYDGGATEAGRPYFAMELVRGVPITDYCDSNRLTTEDRVGLFVDVCDAVQHAHHKGVVHRDLKPSNVLVTVKDNRPVVKIIDFGIAKALGQELTERTLVTRMGQIIGTPEYMSPEQAELSGLDVDTRTDVYSLGVMLYELLVGALPFHLASKADEAIRYAIRETEAPRPSTRLTGLGETRATIAEHRRTTVEALRKELQSDLDWIILKAMEKDRTRRYETANGFGQDLLRHLRNEPVLARGPSAAYRFGKFVRRHRTGVASGLAIAILLLTLALSTSVQAVRIARERDRAEREAAKARAVNDFMVGTLLSPDPVSGMGADATILQALEAAEKRTGERYSDEPEVDAAIRSAIGWAYFKLGRYDDAEPLLREALRIREEISGGDTEDLAESLYQAGSLLEVRADADSAEALYRRALEARRSLLPPHDPRTAQSLVSLSGLLLDRGRYQEAEEGLLEAQEVLEAGDSDPLELAAVTNRLGELHWIQGDLEAAEPHFRRTLALRQARLPADHPSVGESLNNLAVLLDDLGKKEEAEALYREALVAVEAAFGESSDHVSAILGNLGLIVASRGETTEAESLYRRALAIDLGLLGRDHPSVAVDEINLGLLLCDSRQAAEGSVLTQDAVRILATALEPGQWEVGAARAAYGHCLGRAGRYQAGERELLTALEAVEAALGPEHPRVGTIRDRLARLYDAWGRPDEAARFRRDPAGSGLPDHL